LLGFVGCDWVLGLNHFGPGAPTFTPPPGFYNDPLPMGVTLTYPSHPEAKIYFTTDGTPATTQSMLYQNPIPAIATTTINAVVSDSDGVGNSASATYQVGAITFQQAAETALDNTGVAADQVSTPSLPVLADDLIVLWIWYNSSFHVDSVADTAGNLYSCAIGFNPGGVVPPTSPTGWQQEIYYGKVVADGTVAVTAHFAGAFIEQKAISAFLFRHADSDDPIADTPVANFGSSAPGQISTDSITTTTARLVFGAAWFSSQGRADTPTFISISPVAEQKGNAVEVQKISGPGPVSATFVALGGNQQNWIAQMITLK